MKKIFNAMMVLALTGSGVFAVEEGSSPDALVWCGLDYSMVKMIGTMDFNQPNQIFPGMLAAWNNLFIKEMMPPLEKMAKSVRTDMVAVEGRNEKASPSQIEREDGSREEKVVPSHIKEADIAAAVTSYKLNNNRGLGMVFIMDRLVKAQETGCLYVVFFDVASRKVLHSERISSQAGGMGFRNYWFRPVKDAVKKLPKMYKDLQLKK